MRGLVAFLFLIVGSSAEAVTIAAFGDSLTTPPSYLEFLLADHRIDLGLEGEATSDGLVRLQSWLQSGGTADVVILLEGTNDIFRTTYDEAETVGNLAAMLGAILQAGSLPILVTPPPVIAPGRDTEALRAASLADALVTMASSLGVVSADVWAAFDQHPNVAGLYSADGIHPNHAAGDQLIAQTIGLALAIPEPAMVLLLAVGGVSAVRARRRSC